MSKAILLSIKPQYVAKILNGEKTIEIRKHAIPVGTKVYIYVTKNGGNLEYADNPDKSKKGLFVYDKTRNTPFLNGKVVASFVVSECEAIGYDEVCGHYATWELGENELLSKYCLSQKEMQNYLGVGKKCYIPNSFSKLAGFAWHISQLKIFDRPKELGAFMYATKYIKRKVPWMDKMITAQFAGTPKFIIKAPQSFVYVEELKNEF